MIKQNIPDSSWKDLHGVKYLFTIQKQFREELCNCTFKILVPQLIIDKTTDSEFYSDLKIEYTLGNAEPDGGIEDERISISLTIEGKLLYRYWRSNGNCVGRDS